MAELRLLAWPAGHSLSPVMHNAALAELGLDHHYRALEVPPEQLPQQLEQLRTGPVLGANVTVPHKQAVLPYLDSVSEAVRRIGAVNTISRSPGGGLHGDNTDVEGFLALLSAAGVHPGEGGKLQAVVLGAGGAARAAMAALAGHATVTVVNRTIARAEELARDFRDEVDFAALAPAATAHLLEGAQLLVNTTTVGMQRAGVDPDESPVPGPALAALPASAVVVDMVYRPARTGLLRAAAERGLAAHGGLEMLVQQGAASLRIWTGIQEVPVAAMRAAARMELGD